MANANECTDFIVTWLRANPKVLPMEPGLKRYLRDPNDKIHRDRFGRWLWKNVYKKTLSNQTTLLIFHAATYCYLYNQALGLIEDASGRIVSLEPGTLQHFHNRYGVIFSDPNLAAFVTPISKKAALAQPFNDTPTEHEQPFRSTSPPGSMMSQLKAFLFQRIGA